MKTIYALAAAALLSLTACSSDDIAEQGGGTSEADGSIRVHLRVSAGEGTNKTRAWTDGENATTEEMMNVWTVVAVNTTGDKVTSIYACKPSGEPDQEIDDYVELPAAGTYRFYSFANMSPKVVMSLLGIGGYDTPTKKSSTRAATAGSAYGTPTGDTSNDNLATGSVTSHAAANETDPFMTEPTQGATGGYAVNTYYTIPFDAGETLSAEDVASKTVNVAGNNFNLEAADNGFGAKGIPMSNVQTITVTEGMTLDLIVIRMMAKIQLQIYNDRGSDVTLESFTITDVTKNADNNLKLLPKLTNGANTMSYVHGDIKPNLPDVLPGNLILKPASGNTISATDNKTDGGTPVTFTFYVNESNTPNNGFNRFFLKIKLLGESEQRYVLIDDANAEGKTGTWNYIARNDFRIIPVVLDDYKLDIIPYDFPAIGVYPASVKEEDGLYTINFHDYGHFHLLPKVTKMSDGTEVPFTATTPTGTFSVSSWGLIDNDFGSSWRSFSDGSMTTAYDNATASPAFYRTGTDSYVTTTVDGDEVGGAPVWYANTSAPQWDPAGGSTYKPFIFGYIADPGAAITSDRMVFHKFTINLYRDGTTAARQMVYNLCMILDTDQMSYSRGDVTPGGSRGLGEERPRLPHNHIWK